MKRQMSRSISPVASSLSRRLCSLSISRDGSRKGASKTWHKRKALFYFMKQNLFIWAWTNVSTHQIMFAEQKNNTNVLLFTSSSRRRSPLLHKNLPNLGYGFRELVFSLTFFPWQVKGRVPGRVRKRGLKKRRGRRNFLGNSKKVYHNVETDFLAYIFGIKWSMVHVICDLYSDKSRLQMWIHIRQAGKERRWEG